MAQNSAKSGLLILLSLGTLIAEAQIKFEFQELDGVFHEPHNDLEKDQVLRMVSNWIKERIKEISSDSKD